MTAILTAPRTMTLQAFLEWVPGDDRHYELIDGIVVAMNPPNIAHAAIVRNLSTAIDLHLRANPPLAVYPDAGIIPASSDRSFYESDLAVSGVPHQRGQQALLEPVLVVEVLSASTEAHDRMVKLADYRHIPSVREVLLVGLPCLILVVLLPQAWWWPLHGWLLGHLVGMVDHQRCRRTGPSCPGWLPLLPWCCMLLATSLRFRLDDALVMVALLPLAWLTSVCFCRAWRRAMADQQSPAPWRWRTEVGLAMALAAAGMSTEPAWTPPSMVSSAPVM